MDFSTLARRDLQALCKKNKIPANITNVAMVDALNALELVEGIEELLKPGESEMEHSSVESPEKDANTQRSVPRTGYRTSTRQKPVREEDESLQSLTRTHRGGTRRRIAGDVEEAVSGTPAVRSSRKKAPVVELKEGEEDQKNGDQMDKEKKSIPETPAAAAPSTLRRGIRASTRRNMNSDLMEETEEKSTAVRRVYSTRRSVRLSEKKVVESNPTEKERTQPIKIDSFSEDMGEVSENTVLPGSGLPTMLEDCSESNDSQALVGQKSDVSSEALKDLKDESLCSSEVSADTVSSGSASSTVVDLVVNLQMQETESSFAEESVLSDLVIEGAEKPASDASNMSNNPLPDEIQEQSNDNVSADTAETYPVSSEVQEQSNGNAAVDDAETYPVVCEVQDLELSFAADDNFTGKDSKENEDEPEVDSIDINGENTSNNELDSEKSPIAADFSFQNEDATIRDSVGPNESDSEESDSENEVADEPVVDSIGFTGDASSDSESDSEESDSEEPDSESDSEEPVTEESEIEAADDFSPRKEDATLRSPLGPIDTIEKHETEPTNGLSVKLDKTPASGKQRSQIKGNAAALILADDPLPNPSPLKKSSSKTPLSARRMAARASDDKENVDHSGRKLELTKAKGKKAKKVNAEDEKLKAALKEASLRQLTKMLREKLQISNNTVVNNEEEKNVAKVANTRPALLALPENRLEAGGEN